MRNNSYKFFVVDAILLILILIKVFTQFIGNKNNFQQLLQCNNACIGPTPHKIK